MSVRNYIFNKLFFPKVVTIEKPGIIINCVSRKYGGVKSRQRTVFFFEDTIVNLQLETIKELGKKKGSKLWYKIGKDVGMRYMLVGKAKKPPEFLLTIVLNHILKGFKGGGFSLVGEIIFDYKRKSLILKGKDCIVCRKSSVDDFFAGIISGVISFLYNKNIEANVERCNYLDNCILVANEGIKEKYIPNLKELKPLENYERLNFPEYKTNLEIFSSFSEFIKFKKVLITDSGKHEFYGKTIIPSECGVLDLIIENFEKINRKDILTKALVQGTEEFSKDLFKNIKNKNQKIDFLKKILCSFGWGIPYHQENKKEILFTFLYIPTTKYKPLYLSLILNGHLNHIYNRKLKLKKLI